MTQNNTAIERHLGKSSEYKTSYDPAVLVREPRQSNRTHLGINDDDLPFVGVDTWNAYEVSGLTKTGRPVAALAKIVYPCTNKYIVESKSLKLYFNTFNMTKLGSTADEVMDAIKVRVTKDLSELLETEVQVSVYSSDIPNLEITSPYLEYHSNNMIEVGTLDEQEDDTVEFSEEDPDSFDSDFDNRENIDGPGTAITLEDIIVADSTEITVYTETPGLLEVIESDSTPVHYHSALLKSNCRVTSQPDWGDVYIYMQGTKTVTPESLLRYIISFRDECHFHEEICETIYKRLWDLTSPEKLHVMCLYARRGGIDICPSRASDPTLLHTSLSCAGITHIKTARQ